MNATTSSGAQRGPISPLRAGLSGCAKGFVGEIVSVDAASLGLEVVVLVPVLIESRGESDA